MNVILIKMFATAVALSQVTTRPDDAKTRFDPALDQAEVVQLLRDGCTHFIKVFDVQSIDLDGLIKTAMADRRGKAGAPGRSRVFRGINFDDLYVAYRQFCKSENVAQSPVDIAAVIAFYNDAVADLPDHTKLKGMRLPGLTFVLDGAGSQYAQLYEPDSRRVWIPLSDIPGEVRAAFIATEDQRFYQHAGIDERGVIRAFLATVGSSGRRQGGSTITQQLAKNLLVGDEISYRRKIREIIVASRIEHVLSKDEILELYLSTIFLGRGSWGIEMASRSYFGKSAKDLLPAEGALLAALAKGPNAYSPDKHPKRAAARFAYVRSRMQQSGTMSGKQMNVALAAMPTVIPANRLRRDRGRYFIDEVAREAKVAAGIDRLTALPYTVRTTIRPKLQQATEQALQDGLALYEKNTGRAVFYGPEVNLAKAVARYSARANAEDVAWRRALGAVRLPQYDVRWTPAIVIDIGGGKRTRKAPQVGLKNGNVLPLKAARSALRLLKLYDVVYVKVEKEERERAGRKGIERAELQIKPAVQGAAVVIENATGRILAMTGGFSYSLSQLNRVTQARRQPGSALKPLTYLAALNAGLQPNTLVRDAPITLPPIQKSHSWRDFWRPRNYDGGSYGIVTLRRALENSRNQATARLLDGGVAEEPADSLDRICALAREAQLYSECVRYYPFILGAQGVRPIDLAALYAAIASEGARPSPYTIESIEHNGEVVYRHTAQPKQMVLADRPAFYLLKTILQGVVARGTAASMADLSPYVAGKTGTSDNWNDAWFVGFTNDVTIAVWVGYDNSGGKQRTLGPRQAGSRVAIPIFRPIVQAVWDHYSEKSVLRGPSVEAQRHLIAKPSDLARAERASDRSPDAHVEYFRTDENGKVTDTQYRLVARAGIEREDSAELLPPPPALALREPPPFNPFGLFDMLFNPQRRR